MSAEIKTLPPPTGLHVEALSDTSLELSWNAVEGAVSYAVYCGVGYASSVQITLTTGTNFVHIGLRPFMPHHYTVATVTSVGTGVKSAEASEYTQPIPLREGVWKTVDNSVPLGMNNDRFFSFPVTGGTYYVRWNTGSDGDGTKTGSATISAYLKSSNTVTNLGASYFANVDKGYTVPQSISVPSPAFVVLKVKGWDYYSNGPYAIQFYR